MRGSRNTGCRWNIRQVFGANFLKHLLPRKGGVRGENQKVCAKFVFFQKRAKIYIDSNALSGIIATLYKFFNQYEQLKQVRVAPLSEVSQDGERQPPMDLIPPAA